jgi:ribosomal protein L11 methylase PrmA
LLPFSTRFKFSLLSHIHLHAKSQKHFAHNTEKKDNRKVTKLALLGIIDSLESTIKRLRWNPKGTEWADYYDDVNYSREALEHKRQVVAEFLNQVNPKNVWDLGANLGMFSRIAAAKGMDVISFDIDPAAVEKNYLECIAKKEKKILPLLIDFTNPSPGIGWENREIMSFLERGPVEMGLVLALIHHLAISNNLPLDKIASFLCGICSWLVIEFVPKSDSQVQRLLATREDIFPSYTQNAFEVEFQKFFAIESVMKIEDSERTLYLMRRKN